MSAVDREPGSSTQAIGAGSTLLICTRDAEAYARVFTDRGFSGRIVTARTAREAEPLLPHADLVVCSPLPGALLRAGRRVRFIQSTWAGVEGWLSDPPPPGIPLARMHGVFGPWIAEWAFAHLLYAWWGVGRGREQQSRREWTPFRAGRLLGKTLGVAGTGDIGASVAAAAKGFGMRVVGLSRSGRAAPAFDVVTSDLAVFLRSLDAVVITLPLTPTTERLFDAQALALLARGAWLLNAGRGRVVDEAALVAALEAGQLGGAVLDVFENEPLPFASPLWSAPNCYVTPHIAGPSVAEECAAVAFENVGRFLRGEPLHGVVDLERGY